MIIDYQRSIVYLSNTKVASTAMEAALQKIPRMGRINGDPRVKHINFSNYKLIEKGLGTEGFKTVVVARHPFEKAISWYKYRARDEIKNRPLRYTGDMTFKQFIEGFEREETASHIDIFDRLFCTDVKSGSCVDTIFKYDNINLFEEFLQSLYGESLVLEQVNVSPSIYDSASFEKFRELFYERYGEEVRWYEKLRDL